MHSSVFFLQDTKLQTAQILLHHAAPPWIASVLRLRIPANQFEVRNAIRELKNC
jgi:hypothetical protein